jgi:hypothetical protein
VNAAVIPKVCFETSAYVSGSIRSVVLSFHGIGAPPLRETPNDEELELARAGILVVYPYCGPWTWMNREHHLSVEYVEVESAVHCGPLPPEVNAGRMQFLHAALSNR